MERPYTGLTAEIKIGDVPLAYASGIDLTLEKAIIEILQFGARFQEKVPAIKDWSATVDGTVAFAPGGSQQKLYDAFNNDEEVTVGIFLNKFVYFEGKAYVSNLNISGSPDDKMSLSCDLAGNGAVILTLPNTYRVVANSGVGGTVIPGGATEVAAEGTYQVTINCAPNYEVDTLIDNGVDKTNDVAANAYAIASVGEDHNINITFKTIGGADKTKLRAAIVFADTLTSTDYSAPTWAVLTTALTAAKSTNGNVNATQSDVDAKHKALVDATIELEEA